VMGSVGYMAPEQARGERVDARADVYAIGVVLFEMLALRNYIPPGPLPTMIEASTRPRFVRPSNFRPDVPKALDQLCEKALSADREARFQTALELRDALVEVSGRSGATRVVTTLLEQLFGTARMERTEEIQSLMELTVEQKPSEELEKTKVFVSRSSLRAIEPDTTPLTQAFTQARTQTTDHTVVAEARPQASKVPVGFMVLLLLGAMVLLAVALWGRT
jgi:serine/threonine protein kinase